MNHGDSSLCPASDPDWQILGELELTVNADTDHSIGNWLATILSPLRLQADFMNKVLESAQEAAMRAMQSETAMKFGHTRLLLFAPAYPASDGGTWGFFRIEKIDNAADVSSPNYAIEFYLYLEGQ